MLLFIQITLGALGVGFVAGMLHLFTILDPLFLFGWLGGMIFLFCVHRAVEGHWLDIF